MKKISLNKTELLFDPNFLNHEEAWQLFCLLVLSDDYQQKQIKIFGKIHLTPRFEKFCAFDTTLTYGYSGSALKTYPFDDCLDDVIAKMKGIGCDFNSALINLYRDGKDSNGWHRDNEKELGEDPIIYSLSLGASRRFKIRSMDKKEKLDLELNNGSLLIMKEGSQLYYQHQVPKMTKLAEPRINITFRKIYS